MKDRAELLAIARRVRRGTRSAELLDLCEAVENLLTADFRVPFGTATARAIVKDIERRVGRPRLGEKPLTGAEKMRRYRERKRAEERKE